MSEPSRPPLSFETFSAIRRRQQSLKETNAINSVATSIGINTQTTPPAALAELSKDFLKDTFYSSFTTQKIYLIFVYIDVLCVIFSLVYALYHDDVVSVLSTHPNPTMPKLILPTFEFIHTVFIYVAWFISILSVGEMGIYVFALWESRIIWSWFRIIDGFVVIILLTIRSLPSSISVVELIVLLRVVRMIDILQLVTTELYTRTTRYETHYLEERNRSELYQSQMEQMQSKLQDEIKYRTQAELLAQNLANRNERLTVALVIAANEVSQVVGPEAAQNIVNYPEEDKKEIAYSEFTSDLSSKKGFSSSSHIATDNNDEDFEDASSLEDDTEKIRSKVLSTEKYTILTAANKQIHYDNSSIGSRKSKDSETRYSSDITNRTGKSSRLSIQKDGTAVISRI